MVISWLFHDLHKNQKNIDIDNMFDFQKIKLKRTYLTWWLFLKINNWPTILVKTQNSSCVVI
jgi:hypothetical protein